MTLDFLFYGQWPNGFSDRSGGVGGLETPFDAIERREGEGVICEAIGALLQALSAIAQGLARVSRIGLRAEPMD